ncbi:hypothetical protein KIL84_015314 [Mauremys mutica]|uniref:Uncharacterized protein n=1 Tax=Mauremys mutica TaxID=74926 RepID=A0A9D3WS16_9SAUR|nr:hypothetical protein KIL84_015314 [Mauremys mutica]
MIYNPSAPISSFPLEHSSERRLVNSPYLQQACSGDSFPVQRVQVTHCRAGRPRRSPQRWEGYTDTADAVPREAEPPVKASAWLKTLPCTERRGLARVGTGLLRTSPGIGGGIPAAAAAVSVTGLIKISCGVNRQEKLASG